MEKRKRNINKKMGEKLSFDAIMEEWFILEYFSLSGAKHINSFATAIIKNSSILIQSKLTHKLYFKVLATMSIQIVFTHSIQNTG